MNNNVTSVPASPKLYLLSERIKDEINYLRETLLPVIEVSPTEATKAPASSPILNELETILSALIELRQDIKL